MTNERQYLVEIRPLSTDEGGGWLATFPDPPDCMRDGETPEAATEDGYAAAAWLKVAVDCGDAIPEPGCRKRIREIRGSHTHEPAHAPHRTRETGGCQHEHAAGFHAGRVAKFAACVKNQQSSGTRSTGWRR